MSAADMAWWAMVATSYVVAAMCWKHHHWLWWLVSIIVGNIAYNKTSMHQRHKL